MTTHAILVSADDAAVLLSTTRRRVLRLVADKRIPFIDLGDGEPRFVPDELRAWAAAMVRPAAKGNTPNDNH